MKMEGLFAELKSEGFTYSAFTRLTNGCCCVCEKLFSKLSQSQLKMLYHSFNAHLDDPRSKEQPDYAEVTNAFQMLQNEIRLEILVKMTHQILAQMKSFCNAFPTLLFLITLVLYIIKQPDDPTTNAIVLCLLALQIFIHAKIAVENICLRRAFPSLCIHRAGSTKTLKRLCIWLYTWTWDYLHCRTCRYCRYCRTVNMEQAFRGKESKSSLKCQGMQQEEPNKRRLRAGMDDALKEEEMCHVAGEGKTSAQISFPVDHNSINDSLIEV